MYVVYIIYGLVEITHYITSLLGGTSRPVSNMTGSSPLYGPTREFFAETAETPLRSRKIFATVVQTLLGIAAIAQYIDPPAKVLLLRSCTIFAIVLQTLYVQKARYYYCSRLVHMPPRTSNRENRTKCSMHLTNGHYNFPFKLH